MKYQHFDLEERENIFAWKEAGISLRTIAKRLGRNVGNISREIKRNTRYGKKYIPCHAHKRAVRVGERQRYKAPLKEPLVFLYVREHLRKPYKWSPETIAGRLSIDCPGYTIDDDTIYEYVYGKKQKRKKLWNLLRLHRKRRMKHHGRKVKQYARLATAIPIKDRPQEINERKSAGHWETDNMEGKKSDTTGVSVTVDRLTKIIRLRKLSDHKAATKTTALIPQLQQDKAKTVTLDRGPENSDHETITKTTNVLVYGCEPYHSWEKGTVENTVGRVRWFIPKGSSVDGINQKRLDQIEDQMNNTPRKILGFLTPNEFNARIQTASTIP